ncbi:unnamed protein product [Brassica oleracea var. botrytis]
MSIFLCFLLFFPLSLLFFNKLSSSKGKLPPGPKGLPIIGNLHQLGRFLHKSLHKISQEHGPVMSLRFGVVPVVVVSSKEGAEEVLKTHDLETCSRPKTVGTGLFTYNFKDIGFAPFGETWREMRKIAVLELFSQKKLKSFRYIREEESEMLVKKVSKAVDETQNSSSVNLRKVIFSFTASIICRLAFGQNFHECEFVDMERVEELVLESETSLGSLAFADFFPAGWIIDRLSGQHSKVKKAFAKLTNFFQYVIDDHLKNGQAQDHSDIISVMLDMISKPTKGDSFKVTDDHLKGVMSDVFLAGVNAGAITMIWAMTELSRHPRVMKKLQEEIRTTLGPNKEKITEEDLEKAEYLKLVIEETFRLHPPAPLLLPRLTMSDVKIQGYNIPKNTMIQINTYAIGRDPKYWTKPDEFIPERFVDNPVEYKGKHFELLPFGAGRRICPGMGTGITIVELGLLNLLYFFDWSFPEGMTIKDIDMEEDGAFVIAKKVPLELVPIRHRWNLPPGPIGLPIVGNLHQLGKLLYKSLHNLSVKHGPVMLLRFGVVPVVVLSSKEAAKEILKTHDLETCSRPKLAGLKLFSYNFKDIGFTQYGEEWREIKKLVGLELFSPKNQKVLKYLKEEESDLLVKKLSNSAQTETLVDLKKALFSFTAGIIFRLAFGHNFHECEFIDMEEVEEMVMELESNAGALAFTDFFPTGLGWLLDRISGQHSRMNKGFSKLTSLFQHVIDDHLKVSQPEEDSDLVSAMLNMVNKPTKTGSLKITSDHLRGVMSDVFLAGVNAGVITMIWTMTELIRHPRVMKKLQEEIRTTLGSSKERITEEDLEKKVEYMKLVIKESFRLHPPAPLLLPRQTMSEIEIQGYTIPKNSMIKINTYTIGRDPKCWTEAEEFIPERFSDTSINFKGQHFELLPFGAGRRSCPGMALGMANLELGLLNLLYFFDWSLPNGMAIEDIDMDEAGDLNIAKKVPLELVPTLHRW